ncbi:transcription repressor OFP16-like [Lotus japonicus]|uniref:transcription repressor OFP16-like n=1 Tax=Lotus japonicus TaxID=34305 RepID=UPI002586F496|nr:transcription repressor OFP16-like [Lotus japonicus]XP_057427264.1 transcription repressor OFP16-like [Lotus japonicus]
MPSTRNLRNLNLNRCFSNSTTTPESKSSPPNKNPIATIETPSHHSIHHNTPCPSPSIMIKNFNSLYDPSLTFDNSFYSSSFSTTITTSTELEAEPEPEPDLAAAFASKRFFFSSPGHSNSLMKYTNTKKIIQHSSPLTTIKDEPNGEDEKTKKKKKKVVFNGSVAVPTYSPDPYLDFRRSMQEMVEARPELMMDVKSNWHVLHELLMCYLALNPKSTHKFILGAFSDLLVSLLPF